MKIFNVFKWSIMGQDMHAVPLEISFKTILVYAGGYGK